MEKFTTTELFLMMCEMENVGNELMQIVSKFEDVKDIASLKLQADLYFKLAEKLRSVIVNGEKRIAIL